MKLINTGPIRQEKIKKLELEEEEKIIDHRKLIPPEYKEWIDVHKNHAGKKTGAWCGIQWEDVRDYMNIRCGCGSTFIQEKYEGSVKVIQDKRDTPR